MPRIDAARSKNFKEALILESLCFDQRIDQVAEQEQRQYSGEQVRDIHESSPSRLMASTNPTVAPNKARSMRR
jgi:hypothetical protein